MNFEQTRPPQILMMQNIINFWTANCIYAAAKLNLADHLGRRPMTVRELAIASETDAKSLYRLLRALAAAGILTQDTNGRFSLTALGETLREDAPGSMKALIKAELGDHYDAWGNLAYTVETGDTAFENIQGTSIWNYYRTHPEDGLNFMKAMTGITESLIPAILPVYDFGQFHTIVDVGGGGGALLSAVLEAAPLAKGIVFDEPHVVEETEKEIRLKGLADRCHVAEGSFFESLPPAADAYLMKMILHDWPDDKALQILKVCHDAMKPSSKLLVFESILSDGNDTHPGKFMDINMMVMTGGRERTEKEFRELFLEAGLHIVGIHDTASPLVNIMESERIAELPL